ncbi:MAG: IS4 family transposase [Lachnospiraceae bacterium]|nr:IS4 family transposase [Lachnospiraceae bacterium]
MSNYIQNITDSLTNLISELSSNPSLFLRNPQVNFTRNRKISFRSLIGITMNSGGGTMSKELLDYFDFNVNTPTVSAYTQQRSKVLPEAFEYLFQSFTQENISHNNTFKGYKLIACDGSNLTIATNPSDAETAYKSNQYGTITNHLHLNAFFDVLNRIYLDAVLQTASEYQEYRACIKMMERSPLVKAILIADRGYENYNVMAHAINKGWKFVIRIKDIGSNGIASGLKLPKSDTFDTDISLTFTRQQAKAKKEAGYKFMPTCQTFDYLPVKSKDTYALSFRIVRFPISDDSYEVLLTNLNRHDFSIENLKEIYNLRWGIETSFRELKYAIGLTSFHARKVDYIKQEVFARLLLYNYCELITTHVIVQMKNKDKTKQVNFTVAIYICREYLRQKRNLSPPDVIKLIEKHILPVRPGRKDPRKVKPQASVSFLYRVA